MAGRYAGQTRRVARKCCVDGVELTAAKSRFGVLRLRKRESPAGSGAVEIGVWKTQLGCGSWQKALKTNADECACGSLPQSASLTAPSSEGAFKEAPREAGLCLATPFGRDALSKQPGGLFVAKAGSKLCLRPGPKAVSEAD